VNYISSKDKNIREYGVDEIAESIAKNEMTLKVKTLFLKIVASALAFAVTINYLDTIGFQNSQGRVIGNDYFIANLVFIPFITLFVFLYLFLKQRLLYLIDHKIFKKFSRFRNHIFALIGGGVVGTILLIQSHADFSGKIIVMHLMNADVHIPVLFIFGIILLRIIGTTVAIYANAVGGIFLPLMSIGALIGYGFAELLSMYIFPIEPFYFAAIGAAVFMGVMMKLPLTAVILAMETTFDYNVVVGTAISVILVEYFTSLYFDIRKKYVTKRYKKRKEQNRKITS